jgi:hypothetical protein
VTLAPLSIDLYLHVASFLFAMRRWNERIRLPTRATSGSRRPQLAANAHRPDVRALLGEAHPVAAPLAAAGSGAKGELGFDPCHV